MNRFYKGERYQKGFGLGGVCRKTSKIQKGFGLGGLYKKFVNFVSPYLKKVKDFALPMLKSGAKTVGKEIVKTTSSIAKDLLAGRKAKDSIKQQIPDSVDLLKSKAKQSFSKEIDNLNEKINTGLEGKGIKKRINKRRKKQKSFVIPKKKRVLDIFH